MYTIELDNNEGRGELYRVEETGTIWCTRLSDGKQWDTTTPCGNSHLVIGETISQRWGANVWRLCYVEEDFGCLSDCE